MIDVNKPLRLVSTTDARVYLVEFIAKLGNVSPSVIIRHGLSGNAKRLAEFDLTSGYRIEVGCPKDTWRLENVPETPKEHTVSIRVWRSLQTGQLYVCQHHPEKQYLFDNERTHCLAIKGVTFIEGEGLK